MDWNTLLSVALGGLIATLASIINNRFQAKERDKDRQEQKREAKNQLALELMRNDIKIIEDSIENELKSIAVISGMTLKTIDDSSLQDATREEIKKAVMDDNSRLSQIGEFDIIAERLAYCLGQEFFSEYDKFNDLSMEYWNYLINLPFTIEGDKKIRMRVISSGAKLHNMLKEKLISLRE